MWEMAYGIYIALYCTASALFLGVGCYLCLGCWAIDLAERKVGRDAGGEDGGCFAERERGGGERGRDGGGRARKKGGGSRGGGAMNER